MMPSLFSLARDDRPWQFAGKLCVAGLLYCLTLTGCGSSEVTQIGAFDDAAATADAAITALDVDGNGSLDEQELDACLGLKVGASRIDADQDQQLSRDELVARFQKLESMSDIIGAQVVVVQEGRPLANAQVTLTPAPFLGEGLQSYHGKSNTRGSCALSGESVPLPGLPTGYYTAKIVHEASSVESEVGCEISDDASGSRIMLEL